MTNAGNEHIIRTERGLTIAGTRITLYDVIDYLKADYPHKYIRDVFNLTDEQMNGVLAYIEAHQVEVEAEYQDVLQMAQEIRQYWQERNRDRLARIAADPPRAGYEAVRVKLIERRRQREANKK
ncbi:hypothetical protein MC7420_3197 [Coleofasciculus chthonoplastes PCC 7420]|uniref:DUF433 domain-containing protein n=1 Tax=Coleofasciculus chthonoplastes PCC 7420 TaxID=118168 RepID=B4VKH9_9CYAN|nr:DUF433 domain-containing protein [Coleofasciculus chthonoplastes]EDX77873.1 hypothetical protein MC7420_3197 [Coleofasciculus chthonoplastes PCC 7420]